MSRYIDADALLSKGQFVVRMNDYGEYFVTVEEINKMPTIDAVPVVRCRDCVKRPPTTALNGDEPTSDCPLWCGYCFGIDDSHGGEFFCADGERKDDGTTAD